MIIQLPLSSDTAQLFTTQLGTSKYDFTVIWNDRASTWYMGITDNATQVDLVDDIAIVLGTDLLSPYGLGIGSMVAVDQTNQGLDAGVTDLGTRVNVYWFSSDEVAVSP